jgi:hypothetical protein
MSKKKPNGNFDVAALAASNTASCEAHIAYFTMMAQTDAKHEKTAKQWANEQRTLFVPQFFEDCGQVVTAGLVSASDMTRAIGSLVDTGGKRAPVYGLAKIVGTIRSLAADAKSPIVSDLHRAMILALSTEWVTNKEIHETIGKLAFCCPRETAPTQRSTSAYALRSLGLVEERKDGRTKFMRLADNEGAAALARIIAKSRSHRQAMTA